MKSASIMIIADNIQHNLDYCTYLLNLFNKKLSLTNVKLGQVFIVTEKRQFVEQLNLLTNSEPPHDWAFITSTNESNDFLMNELIRTNNNYECISFFGDHQVPVYSKRVFMLNKSSFHISLATCLKFVLKIQSRKLAFADEKSFSDFSKKVNGLVRLKEMSSNYFERFAELETEDERILDVARSLTSDFLEDNLVNADFYLYENLSCSGRLLNDQLPIGTDIDYLSTKFDQKNFAAKLKLSIEVIEKCYAQYSPEEVCISFNGGKDCCVVLYLLYAVALRQGIKLPLHALLIKIPNQFQEMTDYISTLVANTYPKSIVDFIVFNDSDTMKSSLSKLQVSRPEIKAILIGTRRSDGAYFKNLEAFACTDGDWPKYMRVNPILDWSYSEVWYLMRVLKLPYCSLYDCGYTSIDNTLNTVPNKDLLCENGVDYLPAWRLENEASERYSRKKN